MILPRYPPPFQVWHFSTKSGRSLTTEIPGTLMSKSADVMSKISANVFSLSQIFLIWDQAKKIFALVVEELYK